jgi:hypothetical protein
MSLTAYISVSDPVGLNAVQDPDPAIYVNVRIRGYHTESKKISFLPSYFQNFDLSFL